MHIYKFWMAFVEQSIDSVALLLLSTFFIFSCFFCFLFNFWVCLQCKVARIQFSILFHCFVGILDVAATTVDVYKHIFCVVCFALRCYAQSIVYVVHLAKSRHSFVSLEIGWKYWKFITKLMCTHHRTKDTYLSDSLFLYRSYVYRRIALPIQLKVQRRQTVFTPKAHC